MAERTMEQAGIDRVTSRNVLASSLRALVLASGLALTFAACSSGPGGTDVTIGSGQNMDPVTLDFPVFYIKRPLPTDNVRERDARELMRFEIGADLFMRDRASPSAPEVNLTGEITEGLGDIRDLSVSYDGTKVLFSMRAQYIEGADEEDQPTWNIWEYDTTTSVLRRIIASDTIAEEGHDIMPHYLPDGRIVFTSTRQRTARAILLDENKPQFAALDEDNREPAFVLHVMDADGTNINQISFNQSHDLYPSVLDNGKIVFTRWEHHIDDNQFDLYTINPDGTGLELLYGAHSHETGTVNPTTGNPTTIQFLQPRAMQDGRTLTLIRPFRGTGEGGDLVLIDTANFVNNTQPTAANAGLQGPAQQRALPTDVRTIPGPSPGGRYRMASPLFDGTGRLLVSWSQCRLMEGTRIVPCTSERLADPDAVEAPPLYGIYIYDTRDNTQKPVVAPEEGFAYTEVVAGAARPLPANITELVPDPSLLTEGVGILHIRSVYDIDGVDTAPGGIQSVRDPANAAYANRRARFLRIEKAVSQPDDDVRDVPNTAFGPNRTLGMREILGYAPIEPDGSVKVKVPANVAFSISVVDERGKRVSGVLGNRHTNWLQVKPGEVLECNGCHNPNANPPLSHGRSGLFASVNPGAPTTSSAFPNTNPALVADMGETMAEVRNRIMCGGACEPSVDVAGPDYWSMTPGAPVDMCYRSGPSSVLANPADPTERFVCSTGLTTPLPTAASCTSNWTSLCRITIHYEQHIAPLWTAERLIDLDGDSMPDTDGLGNTYRACVDCHSPRNLAGETQVPKGDLDLRNEPSDVQPDHLISYRQLLFARRGQKLNDMGQLEDECIRTEIDPVTMVEVCVAYRNVPASMSAQGALASSRFFNTLEGNTVGTVDHSDFMSPSELRLIAEWLDIGAQYYNDPFAAPEN
jgi:hypothetical protein